MNWLDSPLISTEVTSTWAARLIFLAYACWSEDIVTPESIHHPQGPIGMSPWWHLLQLWDFSTFLHTCAYHVSKAVGFLLKFIRIFQFLRGDTPIHPPCLWPLHPYRPGNWRDLGYNQRICSFDAKHSGKWKIKEIPIPNIQSIDMCIRI